MDDSFGWSGFNRSFHSVTLVKKEHPSQIPPDSRLFFWRKQSLHLIVPDSPPHHKFPIEGESPTVHTPRKKRAGAQH